MPLGRPARRARRRRSSASWSERVDRVAEKPVVSSTSCRKREPKPQLEEVVDLLQAVAHAERVAELAEPPDGQPVAFGRRTSSARAARSTARTRVAVLGVARVVGRLRSRDAAVGGAVDVVGGPAERRQAAGDERLAEALRRERQVRRSTQKPPKLWPSTLQRLAELGPDQLRVADDRVGAEVAQVGGLLRGRAAGERADGRRAPRAALVEQQHTEVLERALEPDRRVGRRRPRRLVPGPALEEDEPGPLPPGRRGDLAGEDVDPLAVRAPVVDRDGEDVPAEDEAGGAVLGDLHRRDYLATVPAGGPVGFVMPERDRSSSTQLDGSPSGHVPTGLAETASGSAMQPAGGRRSHVRGLTPDMARRSETARDSAAAGTPRRAPSDDGGLAEERLDLGEEVRHGLHAVARAEAERLRALGRVHVENDRRLAGVLAGRRRRARGSRPACALRASSLRRTSLRSGAASNAVTSSAISFVSPSLWSTRPLTTSMRSASQQVARGRVDRVEDDDLDAAGDVVEAHEHHRLALLRRQLLERADDAADRDDLAVAAALELGERRSRSCAAAGRGRRQRVLGDVEAERLLLEPQQLALLVLAGRDRRMVLGCSSSASPRSKIEPWPASRSACCRCPSASAALERLEHPLARRRRSSRARRT